MLILFLAITFYPPWQAGGRQLSPKFLFYKAFLDKIERMHGRGTDESKATTYPASDVTLSFGRLFFRYFVLLAGGTLIYLALKPKES